MESFDEQKVEKIVDYYFKDKEFSKDLVYNIKITKEEAINGIEKEIFVNRANIKENQKGFEFVKEAEKIIIPKKTKNNTVIELKGKGNQYTKDESRGNLYVKINIFGKK